MSLRATSLPDPGDPGIITLIGALISFGLAAVEVARRGSIDDVKDAAFLGGLIGVGVGLLVYLVVLIVS